MKKPDAGDVFLWIMYGTFVVSMVAAGAIFVAGAVHFWRIVLGGLCN